MIQNKDCLDFLSELEDDTVDLVVTDPPYFQIVKNEWDNQWSSEEEYLEWCAKWTTECVRVLKPNRCLYVWGTTKTDTFLRYKLDVLNKQPEMVYQSWIIWSYDWGGRTKKTWPRKHEDLLMYSKGEEFRFYPARILVDRKMLSNIRTNMNHVRGKVPTDVWHMNNHTMSKEYVNWHPTQKPIDLLKRIVKAHTNYNEVVLDCFSVSGSTMIAANQCNRRFIGCEANREYHRKSLIRMKKLCREDTI